MLLSTFAYKGSRPLIDEDYPAYADILSSVKFRVNAEKTQDFWSKSRKFIMIEVGKKYGIWSVRALKVGGASVCRLANRQHDGRPNILNVRP